MLVNHLLRSLVVAVAIAAVSAAAEDAATLNPIRLVLVGDSTVASYADPPKDRPDLTGWGQVFGEFFDDRVTVINLARSGRSSKSFVREGLWSKALAAKGDYVFIQFGHNDCPGKGDRSTDPNTDFQDYLRQYIDESRAAGAQPILVTPVARRTFAGEKVQTGLQPYADAVLKVGKEKDVPVIDLHAASMALFNRLGDQGSADLSASADDRSHFSAKGARTMAGLVAGALPSGVPALRPYLKSAAPGREFGYPPTISLEEIRRRIDGAGTVHPRLLAGPAELAQLRRSLDASPLRRELADGVVREARAMCDLPPIERQLEGRRLLGESRRCVKRVVTLAMAYHLSGDEALAARCRREMLAAARFSDWNPSHFLDVGEMTFALAIGYDWLYDQLDEPSREEIRKAIVAKGVALPFETRHRGWVGARNNWGQVCHAGLTAGALAVMEHHPDLAAKTVHNALLNVPHAMAAYAPKGSYPEGPGYWAYGTNYNVLLIGVLESVLGSDFGLSQAPGFDLTGQYPSLATGPSGLYFNYADGSAVRGADAAVCWFAARYGRPDWLLGEPERLRRAVAQVDGHSAAGGGGRLLPLALLWMQNTEQPPTIDMPLHWQSEGATPIAVHRGSWTDPAATFVGLKGGSPSGPHGQMDVGSFVLDSDGVRWAVDLGAEGYHKIESRGMNLWSNKQDSDRWTIFRQSNHGHNTLVIDGQLQHAAGHAAIAHFSDDPAFPCSMVDMSPVYQGQATRVRRGVALLPSREVLVQDHLTGLKPGSRVRWGMITPGTPTAPGAVGIDLAQGEARLALRILAPPAVAWQVVDTATPRHEWDSPNPGTCMVAFEAVAPESGELMMAVLATPGSCKASVRETLRIRDWQK